MTINEFSIDQSYCYDVHRHPTPGVSLAHSVQNTVRPDAEKERKNEKEKTVDKSIGRFSHTSAGCSPGAHRPEYR